MNGLFARLPLFPAIKAELILVAFQEGEADQIRVTSDWHEQGVDLEAFYCLGVLQVLMHAQKNGIPPQRILEYVLRMAGGTGR